MKITGYVCAFSFAVCLSIISEEKANKIAHSIGMLGGISASAEQVICIHEARKRQINCSRQKDII